VHRGIYQHDVFVRDIAKETDQSKD
jgi:hypothetical protein